MKENDMLSRKQRRFVQALLTAGSVREAAGLAGIAEVTAWRWLRDEGVKAEVSKLQDAMLAEVTSSAVQRMTAALDVLAAIMADERLPASSRVSAARAILESGLRFAELVTLAERVAVLEQKLGEKK